MNAKKYGLLCICMVLIAAAAALFLSKAGSVVAVLAEKPAQPKIFVIDAGHGGEDGGAVSALGTQESGLNLEISGRLNALMRFLGLRTKMIRTEDISVYTEGTTIAQKKVSDIKNRVRIVESTPNAILVSIHQNHFSEAKYRGAQVFYNAQSEALAKKLQQALCTQVDTKNHRECKPAQNIYLMEHVTCPAVLIECGFLSNPQEELLLRDASYQKKLVCAIACTLLNDSEESNEV